MIKRLEFHISYSCVNNCSFCSEYDRMEQFKKNPVSFNEIKKELILKKKAGFDFVNFTGGEPTVHPDFLEIIKFAKSLGYRIYVGTNGSMLAKSDFCERAVPFLDEISFSVHGHNAGLHDKLSGRRGAFGDIAAAIRNAGHSGFLNLFANTVVVKDNFESLEKILEFLGRRRFKQALFSNIAPEGMGLKRYADLTARIGDWRKKVPKLAKMADKYGVGLRFFGLPLCALGEYEFLSNDLFWDARLTAERADKSGAIGLVGVKSAAPDRNRIKTGICAGCGHNKICFGVFSEYVKNFGDKELKPFEKEK